MTQRSYAILLLLVAEQSARTHAFQSVVPSRLSRERYPAFLLQATNNNDGPSFPWETPLDMANEETLLKIHLTLQDGTDPDVALAQVQQYTQSFPFAAVLPVQPLQYLPTHDGGVDVLFLRKKTQTKGSVDGGLRFFVLPASEGGGIEVEVKRNSKGQSVAKLFTEKLVVQAYCDGITGKDEARTGKAPTDYVAVSSVFHKWL